MALFFRRLVMVLPLPLLLCSCGINQEQGQPQGKQAQREQEAPKLEAAIVYQPDAYLLHLSLAGLALQSAPASVGASAADFDIARAYSNQRPEENITQSVVVMEYTVKGQGAHSNIVVPFDLSGSAAEFPALEEAMQRLDALSYTMNDLRLVMITLPPPAPLADEGSSAEGARKLVEERLQPLIKTASPLPAVEQARVSLNLLRFFMRHSSKEPAYLTMENAKQSLAAAEAEGSDPKYLRRLSQELETEEGQLYKTMPFTLGF